jgi:hypothetical protein
MAPARAALQHAAKVALWRAVPQAQWLAAQVVSQWVGPEAAVSEGAVRRWAPLADVVKETARCEDEPLIVAADGCCAVVVKK